MRYGKPQAFPIVLHSEAVRLGAWLFRVYTPHSRILAISQSRDPAVPQSISQFNKSTIKQINNNEQTENRPQRTSVFGSTS